MNKETLDLYTDYLISSFGQTTATGFSRLMKGDVSHDQVSRMLASPKMTSKDWWLKVKPEVRKIEQADGLPAFIILMSVPDMTELLFVWTINPEINARLIGVMYSNALLLVGISAFQTKWANVRINMVVITLFSILATVLTFFYLKPFLAHPWYHLAYWLTMYFVLFFTAPYVFLTHEKKYGGKLPIQIPLNFGARLVAGISMLISLVCGLGLLFKVDVVNQFWPWKLPPLVGGLIGVLFVTHTAAYAWALWDGDWLRGTSDVLASTANRLVADTTTSDPLHRPTDKLQCQG